MTGHLFKGPDVAPDSMALAVHLLLTFDTMLPLIGTVCQFCTNGLFFHLGQAVDYCTILTCNQCCPVPLLCGGVGTGNSLAL